MMIHLFIALFCYKNCSNNTVLREKYHRRCSTRHCNHLFTKLFFYRIFVSNVYARVFIYICIYPKCEWEREKNCFRDFFNDSRISCACFYSILFLFLFVDVKDNTLKHALKSIIFSFEINFY